MADTTQKPNYTKIIHTEAMLIAHEILDLLAQNKVTFIADQTEEDPAKLAAQEEANADFGIKIVNLLATKNIPSDYASMAIEKIVQNLAGLKAYVDGTINQYHDEFMSRSYAKKNWEGKYRREEVTVGDILLKLDEVRKATGDNRADYFNEVAPEIESPYAEKLAEDDSNMV